MEFRSVLVTRSYEQVVQQIHDRIRRGLLLAGQRLPTERELAESFGVSRGVIREAIKVLGSMGLVESRQGSGTYVSANPVPSISRALTLSATTEEQSLLSLLELREPLDVASARFAALRRTPDQMATIERYAEESIRAGLADDAEAFGTADLAFHRAIGEASHSPYVHSVLSAVRDIHNNVMALIVRITGSMEVAGDHHRQISEAIANQMSDDAAALMLTHVRYSADAVLAILARPEAERAALGLAEW